MRSRVFATGPALRTQTLGPQPTNAPSTRTARSLGGRCSRGQLLARAGPTSRAEPLAPGWALTGGVRREIAPAGSAGSGELLVDPGVRFRRLDAAREGDLVRAELACFRGQLFF